MLDDEFQEWLSDLRSEDDPQLYDAFAAGFRAAQALCE